jgi:chromosome segregation ATPase
MLSLFDDQLIDDVFSRAEQSRVSYNLQTEEFRTLNADLQSYLGDIKTIDDDNHQLQENIEQIRTKYILQLENHLKLLPNDFRVQSQILTDAHLERYKLKSRTRRFISEREEIKRRINFVATNEKDQIKHLNILQKQERLIHNEYLKLNEQLERLLKYVENEKQTYRQAMDKVDDLQTQLEQICIERSKTEFEIQTLKEEVKLMQTTKEFLNEERETILSTQTEANEYLLSRLNDSINRIREDFDQLNKTQLQQIENDYKQILQNLEENLINNQTKNTSQEIIPSEYERLENEHQSVLQELTTLNDQNQILSQRILAMVCQNKKNLVFSFLLIYRRKMIYIHYVMNVCNN